jgi:fatty-acyl-CoA synthase
MSDSAFQPDSQGLLGDLLHRLAHERGAAEALVYPAFAHGGHALRLDFAELDRQVDQVARGLHALGIQAGDRIAVWAANVPDWIRLEYALARIGAVLVTVNTSLQRDEVAYVLEQSRSVAVFHTSRTGTNDASGILDELFQDAPPALLRMRVWMPCSPDETPPRLVAPPSGQALSMADVVARADDTSPEQLREREARLDPTDVVNIQYTSGTTGFPKGVMLSHRNILASSFALGDLLHLTPDDRTALMVPLFHCFGCVVAVLGTHVYGASLHCIPSFEPEHALRLVHEERCTIIHGVPTMYGAMIAHPERAKYDTSSLRTGLCAGAACPVPLMRAIRDDLQVDGITVAFGLTEAAPGVSACPPEDPFEARSETIGRPIHGVEIRITDPATGDERPAGQEGEIRVRGPNIMVGYNDDPQATAAAITADGWLCTGDLGVADEQGLLRVVGRIKDIIIRGGENIAPAEIENVLREHPDIIDAAVVGIPHERFGEEVAAALVLADGRSPDPEAYAQLLDGRIAGFKHPKHYCDYEVFPLTGSGKVKKFVLSKEIAERVARARLDPRRRCSGP